ncbi:MAG: sialate O-acetylesterase, partial [Chitinophagaceae bacterium]
MRKIVAAIIYVSVLASSHSAHGQVKLPRLIRDSMVLQRDVKVNIWGWASKGEKITIRFNNKIFRTTAGTDGKWSVLLNPMKAGGPYTMNITGRNKIT